MVVIILKRFQAYTHGEMQSLIEYGRKFIAAYVECTHYVERLHIDAMGPMGHSHGKAEGTTAPAAAPAHQH